MTDDQAKILRSIGIPATTEEWFELSKSDPVPGIEIDGVFYRFGQFSDEQFAAAQEFGNQLLARKRFEHSDPYRTIRPLLEAGDPGLDWETIRPLITHEHTLLASRETLRQAAVRAFAATAMSGKA